MSKVLLSNQRAANLRDLIWRNTRLRKSLMRLGKLDKNPWQKPHWTNKE